MTISYIILAHKNPQQFERLINSLDAPWVHFYIHVDKDVVIASFLEIMKNRKNVYFLNETQRISCVWGNFSIVQATLNTMKKIVEDKRKGYCILLSAQDYPVKSITYIRSFLIKNRGVNFMDGFPLPVSFWTKGGIDRLNEYTFHLSKKKGDLIMLPPINKIGFFIRLKAVFYFFLRMKFNPIIREERKFPDYLRPYGGSQWWVLPIETIVFILDFLAKNPDYEDYHRYTYVPDEIFFHSIVFSNFEKEVMGDTLTYVNWKRKGCPLPVVFSRDDFDELINLGEDKLFARKFDMDFDEGILDRIDSSILKINK